MDVKFSIIVPVYKAEKYIGECIESVLSQTYSSFELILIDDGSPDDSYKICEQYQKTDERIKFLRCENRGVSEARNEGLKMATGEYIMFLDSDDMLKCNTLESLSCYSNDVICFSWELLYSEGRSEPKKLNPFCNECIPSIQQIQQVLLESNMLGSACLKAIKRSVIEGENGIRFKKDIFYLEDQIFCCEVLDRAQNAIFIDDCFYIYRKNEEGAVQSFNNKKYSCFEYLIDFLSTKARLWQVEPEKARIILGGRYYELLRAEMQFLFTRYRIDKSQKKQYYRQIVNSKTFCSFRKLRLFGGLKGLERRIVFSRRYTLTKLFMKLKCLLKRH